MLFSNLLYFFKKCAKLIKAVFAAKTNKNA